MVSLSGTARFATKGTRTNWDPIFGMFSGLTLHRIRWAVGPVSDWWVSDYLCPIFSSISHNAVRNIVTPYKQLTLVKSARKLQN